MKAENLSPEDARMVVRPHSPVDPAIARYVYILQERETGLYKIGITGNPLQRFKSIGIKMEHLSLILMVKAVSRAAIEFEKKLHGDLMPFNHPHPLAIAAMSEWYLLDDCTLADVMDRIQSELPRVTDDVPPAKKLHLAILRKILKCWRDAEGFSLRTMATQIGIDHAALDRFERGDDLNSANLCKVVVWLLSPEKEMK